MPASTDTTDLDDISFLGRLSEALSQRIEEQTRPLFDDAGITIPVRSCSLLTALDAAGEASAAELARALGQSHQLVVQKCPALLRLGVITQHADPADARRKILRLTDAGRDFLPILMAIGAWGRKYNGGGALARHLDAETGEAVRPVVIDTNTGAPIGSRPLRFEYPE